MQNDVRHDCKSPETSWTGTLLFLPAGVCPELLHHSIRPEREPFREIHLKTTIWRPFPWRRAIYNPENTHNEDYFNLMC